MSYLLYFAVLLVVPTPSQGCSQPNGWRPKPLDQRVPLADIVVHAKVLNKTETPRFEHDWPDAYSGIMEVYCVMKGGPLPQNITVVEMGSIAGQCVSNDVDIDEEYILLLTRHDIDNTTFLADNVNVQAAVIPATQGNLEMVAVMCALPSFTFPLGDAGNAFCPIRPLECGAASHFE
ncbi:PREDICTED: coiled-coil domain-containing protein 3-like [Branchiostoma belcheri]|uniref:Coiled-coil domain-containing protein 3-like n=1 Tax=Branchiostoma belcheri TaxID=7741 RepID=A0A6P4ZGY9_BRABE|nr:PREDICTED: coiled-coil domain-containing protein 3-like [Branchiostoma belcheri]